MKNIFKSLLRVAVILILIIVILLMCIFIPKSIEYSRYEKTGIMKNGNLCISHMCEGGSGAGTVFGKVYKPINAGKSDIYVGYSKTGGEDIRYFELYHVEVDKDLNITYTMETIDRERFEQAQK